MEERVTGRATGGVYKKEQKEAGPGRGGSEREARLYQKIGQLEVELDWLKKKSEELNG